MKTYDFQKLFIALFTLLAINLLSAQQYDDLYYNPKTDKEIFYPVASVEEEETDAVTEERYADNQDDDDASYSSRLHRFGPSARYRRGFDYGFYNSPMVFDPYGVGSMGMMYNAYTYNPYSYYGYNDYFNSPWSYNSYYGGYGNGYAYNPYGFYDPYWSNYNYSYHNYNNNYNNNNNNGGGMGNGLNGGSSNGSGVGAHYGPRHAGNGLVVAPVRSNPYTAANTAVNTGRHNPRPTITNTNTGNEATPVRQNRVRVVRSQETNSDNENTPVRATTQRETRSYNPPARSSNETRSARSSSDETRSYSPPARSSSSESSSSSSSRSSSSSSRSSSSSSGPRKH